MSSWCRQTGRSKKERSGKDLVRGSSSIAPSHDQVKGSSSSAPSQVPSKTFGRKTAVVSLVHKGTPPKLDAAAGHVYRVSPLPKKSSELNLHQIGIVKSFEESSKTPLFFNNKDVVSYMKEFVATYEKERMELRAEIERLKEGKASKEELEGKASKEELEGKASKEELKALEEVIGLRSLEKGLTIRRVVSEWKKSKNGKMVLKAIGNAVKSQYDIDGIPEHRKNFNNILSEIKDVIRMEDMEKATPILATIKRAISTMDGDDTLKLKDVKNASDGLIDLMSEYLGTNKKVHLTLQKAELDKIAKLGYDMGNGGKWLTFFCQQPG